MAAAAASEGSLAVPAGGTQTFLGPCLVEGMGEASLIAALKAWGAARDREVLDLKANLLAT